MEMYVGGMLGLVVGGVGGVCVGVGCFVKGCV